MKSLKRQLSLSMMAVVLFAVAVISVLANLLVSRSFERYVARQQKVRLQD